MTGRSFEGRGREPRATQPAPEAGRADGDRAVRRGLNLLGALALIGCVQLVFMIGVELDRALRHEASLASLRDELIELEREAEGLRAVVGHADDDVFREQLARRQGFMHPSETRVVVLPASAR